MRATAAVAAVLACAIGLASGAAAATHGGVALPDTGLFAPVAEQLRERLDHLERIPAGLVTPARIRLLLGSGQPQAAFALLDRVKGHRREVMVTQARALMTVQDFEAAAPLMELIQARRDPNGAERAVIYAWLRARDDAPQIDARTRERIDSQRGDLAPDRLAAARLAYDRLDYERAESMFTQALEAARDEDPAVPTSDDERAALRSAALVGLGLVYFKRREWEASLEMMKRAIGEHATSNALVNLANTLIRLGRTDEAISACEWGVRLNPYDDRAHYYLGNGYARRNYSQLEEAYLGSFASGNGRAWLRRADSLLTTGRREAARAAYATIVEGHPTWVDARVRLASLDFEDGRFAASRDHCLAALRACPEYGRAHAVLAKALESQRFEIDVHRADYERRFAAKPMPDVPGIERFIANWASLSPRHQKRIAMSVEPWQAYIPVLVEGGATYFIKPLYSLLSECPGLEALRNTRISYDSRLWDDVRGAGGYHTVTGIEDVERTIFDRYDTVLHELTHQVHRVLTADDRRVIQEHYKRAKQRQQETRNGFLSRYAGGSVFEYFAEGANSYHSPRRDSYDPREVVRERLDTIDPDLREVVKGFLSRIDVSASYPIAYVEGGDNRVWRGQIDEAIPLYEKALALAPSEETALDALAGALTLANRADDAQTVAERAVLAHPTSGALRVTHADAAWHGGQGPRAALRMLENVRTTVRAEDRYQIDLAIGRFAWVSGDAERAIAAFDSVLAYQSDNPGGMRGRAAALALAERWDEAFALYDQAVRVRTGVVDLRCEYARDLLRAGRWKVARTHLDEARLLDEENPTAEALRAWAELLSGDLDRARAHALQAVDWGPWCDLATIVRGAVDATAGDQEAARAAWAPVEARIEDGAPPEYVYRPGLSTWEQIHTLPSVERAMLARFRGQ